MPLPTVHGRKRTRDYTAACSNQQAPCCLSRAIPFFTLGKELVLVTRCVSEGCLAVSLAYAAGYESLSASRLKK